MIRATRARGRYDIRSADIEAAQTQVGRGIGLGYQR